MQRGKNWDFQIEDINANVRRSAKTLKTSTANESVVRYPTEVNIFAGSVFADRSVKGSRCAAERTGAEFNIHFWLKYLPSFIYDHP